MMVAPADAGVPDVDGLCGVVNGSILPHAWGLEAGQSAFGDILNWFIQSIQPGGPRRATHEALTAEARRLAAGESGLLALDWHNGNRSVLADPRLTGMLMGMTLQTTPAEIYRALVEASAFGARVILERFQRCGAEVQRVVASGGIAAKNALVMQIYADATGRTVELARSEQACALGAAMAGAVVAGPEAGGHADFADAVEAMGGTADVRYEPDRQAADVYDRLYALYRRLHDDFGAGEGAAGRADVMKELLAIRDEVRGGEGARPLESPEKGAR
jgi:L-ribulokinase